MAVTSPDEPARSSRIGPETVPSFAERSAEASTVSPPDTDLLFSSPRRPLASIALLTVLTSTRPPSRDRLTVPETVLTETSPSTPPTSTSAPTVLTETFVPAGTVSVTRAVALRPLTRIP